MKRYFLILLGLPLFFCIFSCGKKDDSLPKVPTPSWSVEQPAQYPATMTAVVQVPNKILKYINKDDKLAAFINDSCRGTGTLVQQGDISAFFIMIYGKASEKGMVQFKYYSALNSYLYATDPFLPFAIDNNYGTVDTPMVLELSPVK